MVGSCIILEICELEGPEGSKLRVCITMCPPPHIAMEPLVIGLTPCAQSSNPTPAAPAL